MDFLKLNKEQLDEYVGLLFCKFNSPQEVRDWILFFLDLDVPSEYVDPDSTSSPIDAIWQIYDNIKQNKGGEESPAGYVLLSCREGIKTLATSLLELILLLHFELDIGHASATEAQSSVGLGYIESFLNKVEPLMLHSGWVSMSQNKRTFSFRAPSGKTPYIKILICSPKGMNSLHCNVLFIDELDLADPAALKEGRNIIGYSKGIYGLSIFLSTLKYSFGNMANIISRVDELNYKLLKWNIIDCAERCPATRHKPKEPKYTRYVAKDLPLRQLSEDQYDFLTVTEQGKFDKIEGVYSGCVKCPLLPVCRMRLATKPDHCASGFYKPIVTIVQKFRENDVDEATSQLMCWRAGSTGLVYPRFVSTVGIESTNVITLQEAYKSLTGKLLENVSEDMLLQELKKQEIVIDGNCDFGFTHEATIGIAAFPADEIWAIDQFSAPGLEFSELLEVAIKFRDKYDIAKMWADQARPEFISTFNKHGIRSPKFTKDVIGGISALRAKILDGTGRRKFKVVLTENNKKLINALSKHKFITDALGNPTDKPADEMGIADIADAWRMLAQNRFPVRGAGKIYSVVSEPKNVAEQVAQTANNSFLKAVKEATGVTIGEDKPTVTKKNGGFYFRF
jgi:hypothetical protein